MLWVFILTSRKGLFVFHALYPGALNGFRLSRKTIGVCQGSTHGEANDKCIRDNMGIFFQKGIEDTTEILFN